LFAIKEQINAAYWMDQDFPVMLVIRSFEGEVRWMEVRDWLKQESADKQSPIKHISFVGERFDVMSVRRWRDRLLSRSQA
jgi:hypothetical protein